MSVQAGKCTFGAECDGGIRSLLLHLSEHVPLSSGKGGYRLSKGGTTWPTSEATSRYSMKSPTQGTVVCDLSEVLFNLF